MQAYTIRSKGYTAQRRLSVQLSSAVYSINNFINCGTETVHCGSQQNSDISECSITLFTINTR